MNMEVTRVVLADDHPRVRAGLRTILEGTSDIVVVGEASNGLQALELVEHLSPDVLLLDMEMPVMNGKEVAQKLQEAESRVQVLVVSAYDDRQYILGMLANGAAGYLTKDEAPKILVKAIRGVARGEHGWVSRRVADKIASEVEQEVSERITLTLRQREVLKHLVDSKTNPEIAAEMGISESMVQRHLDMLCSKLGATNREDLARIAVMNRYV